MLPETLLIIDTETTGLEPGDGEAIELGAILYSVPYRSPLMQLSTLLPVKEGNPTQHINRISAEASRSDYPHDLALKLFEVFHDRDDYLVAHNVEFDRKWFGHRLLPSVTKPWLCTCDDFLWPQATRERPSLVNLALEHGIGVSSAHRAITDCQLIAALFDRVDNFEAILEQAIARSHEDWYYIVAEVSYPALFMKIWENPQKPC
jgi:DNA polymerase-3 subunit epsilon